jgi:pilus assembly protein Flp/PilA
MKNTMTQLFAKMKCLVREEGQDLVEYALVVALIAFACTAGMSKLATAISTAFSTIGSEVTSSTAA